MNKIIGIFLVLFMVPLTSAGAEEGKKIFEQKCSQCHALERAMTRKRDLAAWKSTTLRMARYSRWAISSDEAEKVAEYLSSMDMAKGKSEYAQADDDEKKINVIEKHEMFDFKKVRTNQFVGPAVCSQCHSEIYGQWNGSMHSKAFTDPLWRAASRLFFKEAVSSKEILETKACVKCHTPLGFRSYSTTSPGEDYNNLTDVAAQGIFCNWCHNISDVKHIGDADYEVEPGGGEDDPSTMLGPYRDSDSPYHPTKYSELHTKSEFCGLCHDVSHAANRLPFEQTYTEWKNSPYNTGDPETTVHCQDCHMRQKPGIPATGTTERPDNPGKACDDGPERDHVWTHYFVGANAVITKLGGNEEHAKMAVERLQNTADLVLNKTGEYKREELAEVHIKVINSGAGHYLPTGLTEIRQMWLDVKITDAAGAIILHSGRIDEEGNIGKDAVKYFTQLGDEKGEPVLNIAKADRILYDHRIPPKGFVMEKYAFIVPDDAVSPLKVEATLKYRSASQSLVNDLLGEGAPHMPVVDMVGITEKIKF